MHLLCTALTYTQFVYCYQYNKVSTELLYTAFTDVHHKKVHSTLLYNLC